MIIGGRRWVGAFLTICGLFLAAVPVAGTAHAAPTTQDWWYTRLDVAKANRTSTGTGVIVAVVDTGVQSSLADLQGRVLPGTSFYGTGDGRRDTPDKNATYFGHGTAMAGYIAGDGRGAGMRGIAPGAKILPVAVGPNDGATNDTIRRGIVYAADHGAKIINLSLGTPGACPADMQRAVDYALRKDVILVASTGNTAGGLVASPASCVGTIAVGGLAYAAGFEPWAGGTTGPALDFVAPAEHMRSLLLDNTLSNPGSGGTSDSAAFVSGIFALLRSTFPNEPARQIVTRGLWNVKNNLGGKVFARRINDQLGYGEILPAFALTQAPPAGAANPIYDEIDKHLRATAPSSRAPGSNPPSSAGPTSAARGATSRNDSGGLSNTVVAVIVVLAVVLAVLAIVLIVRSRRRSATTAAYGPSGFRPPPGRDPPSR